MEPITEEESPPNSATTPKDRPNLLEKSAGQNQLNIPPATESNRICKQGSPNLDTDPRPTIQENDLLINQNTIDRLNQSDKAPVVHAADQELSIKTNNQSPVVISNKSNQSEASGGSASGEEGRVTDKKSCFPAGVRIPESNFFGGTVTFDKSKYQTDDFIKMNKTGDKCATPPASSSSATDKGNHPLPVSRASGKAVNVLHLFSSKLMSSSSSCGSSASDKKFHQ